MKNLVVRVRAAIPDLRRNVNSSYLRNRPNNRYGLIPYVGPILSGLSAFMNQPPLKEEGKRCRIIPYIANFVTYGLFCLGVWLYEEGKNAVALLCIILSGILAVFDVLEDVSIAMNFSYEKKCEGKCGKEGEYVSDHTLKLQPIQQQSALAMQPSE